jgi:hypothetical protein
MRSRSYLILHLACFAIPRQDYDISGIPIGNRNLRSVLVKAKVSGIEATRRYQRHEL